MESTSRWETTRRSLVSFACGFAYGTASVVVGQPLDVLKTRLQAAKVPSGIIADWAAKPTSWYKGATPMLLGGALFRSAQFGVFGTTLDILREQFPTQYRICGVLDWHIVVAGFAGGFGRGVVEGPFEYIKVRRIPEALGARRESPGEGGVDLLDLLASRKFKRHVFDCIVVLLFEYTWHLKYGRCSIGGTISIEKQGTLHQTIY